MTSGKEKIIRLKQLSPDCEELGLPQHCKSSQIEQSSVNFLQVPITSSHLVHYRHEVPLDKTDLRQQSNTKYHYCIIIIIIETDLYNIINVFFTDYSEKFNFL